MLKFLLRGKKLLLSVEVNHRFILAVTLLFSQCSNQPNPQSKNASFRLSATMGGFSYSLNAWVFAVAKKRQ